MTAFLLVLTLYQHRYLNYCSDPSHPPGTLGGGNENWTGS